MKKLITIITTAIMGLCTTSTTMAQVKLPEGVIVHFATAPLADITTDIENLAIASTKGTPAQMFAMPGMLRMQMPSTTGLPPAMVDFSKPLHAFISELQPNHTSFSAALIPIKDFDNQIKLIGGLGFNKLEHGIYQKQNSNKVFLGFYKKQFAIFANSQINVAFGLQVLKRCKTLTNPKKGITIDIDVAKIIAKHGSKLEEKINSFSPDKLFKNNKSADIINVLYPIIKGAGDSAMLALKELDNIKIHYLPSSEGLKIINIATPKHNTNLANINNALASLNGVPQAFKYLPKQSAAVGYINYNENLLKTIEPLIKPIIDGLDKSTGTNLNITKLFKQLQKISGSNQCYGIYTDKKTQNQITVAYVKNKDSKQYRQLISETMPKLNTWLKNLLSNGALPISVDVLWKTNAGKISSQKYDTIDVNLKSTDPSANEQITKALKNSSTHSQFVFLKDSIISTSITGKGQLSNATKNAIQNYKNKTNGIGSKANINSITQQYPSAFMVNIIYPLDLIKSVLIQQAKQNANSMQYLPLILETAKQLPSSSTSFDIAASSDKKSLSLEVNLPARAINEVIIAGMQAFTKAQMQQQMTKKTILPKPPTIK